MKEFKIKLYSFDELSKDAKHNVCENERNHNYNFGMLAQGDDANDRMATLDAFCKLFGIVYRIDYDHCHRFISWRFEDESIDDLTIKGKYLLRFLNKRYNDFNVRKTFWLPFNKGSKKRESKILWIKGVECPFTGMYYDCDILENIFKWYAQPDWNITLKDFFDNIFRTYMKYWADEDDYRMSDEGIGEMISINREDTLYFSNGEEFSGDVEELEDYSNSSVA